MSDSHDSTDDTATVDTAADIEQATLDIDDVQGLDKDTVKEAVREVLAESTLQFVDDEDEETEEDESSSRKPGLGTVVMLILVLIVAILAQSKGLGPFSSSDDDDPSVDVDFEDGTEE